MAISAVKIIKDKFEECGREADIPKLKGGYFKAKLVEGGIEVDNLGTSPFLPWAVFQEAICLLIRNNGRSVRGDAMAAKLGEPGLEPNTIEGHIAQVVYGKRIGDSVFRRITPIACILVWAELCEPSPGELILTAHSRKEIPMSSKLMDYFNKQPRLGTLSTASKDGKVNSAYFGSPYMVDEKTIIMGLTKNRTLFNLHDNPNAVFMIMEPGKSISEWKGLRIYVKMTDSSTAGEKLDQMKAKIAAHAGEAAACCLPD